MSVTYVAVILCMRTGPAYEEESMKMDYPDARMSTAHRSHPSHQHMYLAHLLADDIHECFSAYIPSLEH